MPGSTVARSCFRGLAKALSAQFSDESLREGYESAGMQIRELPESQPDVPVTQDSLAGFLNGFVLARTQCAELTDQPHDAMCQVIGGVHLLAAKAPLSGRPAQLEALRNGFYQRLSTPLLGRRARRSRRCRRCPRRRRTGPPPRQPPPVEPRLPGVGPASPQCEGQRRTVVAHGQRSTRPPSVHSVWPVSAAAASEARKATVAATSTGTSVRGNACRDRAS